MESTFCVYILRSETDPTKMYCGYTNNIQRRIRQHNGEIKGGGKYTSANRPWKIAAIIHTTSKSESLKVEYCTKAKNYKSQKGMPTECPVRRRVWLMKSSMSMHNIPEDKVTFFDEELKAAFLDASNSN